MGSVGAALNVQGQQHGGRCWDVQMLPAYMLASWKLWESSEVMCVASDASRLGQPAEDTVTYAVTDGVSSSWLPPQAFERDLSALFFF